MWCEEREELEANLAQTREIFRVAMESLHARIGICPTGEFHVLSAILDSAQVALKAARSALDQHVGGHYCESRASEDTGPVGGLALV